MYLDSFSLPVYAKSKSGKPISFLTSDYGFRIHPKLGVLKMHDGLDIASNQGAPIIAVDDGVVVSNIKTSHGGNQISIKHDGGKYISGYLHMLSPGLKKVGSKVKKGELIGFIGSTGRVTGNHVHFYMKKRNSSGGYDFVNPATLLNGSVPISSRHKELRSKYGKEFKMPQSSGLAKGAAVVSVSAAFALWMMLKSK